MLDMEYYNAVLCYKLHGLLGWKYPHPVNGLMVARFPRIQNWLSLQIPYDSW